MTMPANVPPPPPVSAMIALVRQAEQNDRAFQELSSEFVRVGEHIVSTPKPAQKILKQWQAIHQQVADTVRRQTEVVTRGAELFQQMHADYQRMIEVDARIKNDYTDLHSRFMDKLLEAQTTPSDSTMRQAVLGYQLMKAQSEGMTSRLKSLEEGKVPEAEGRIRSLTEALAAEARAKHRVFWYTLGLVAVPPAVAFILGMFGG